MDARDFAKVRLEMFIHDLKCWEPDKMYTWGVAERACLDRKNNEKLRRMMRRDGKEDVYEKNKDNVDCILKLYAEYGISTEMPYPSTKKRIKRQLRCLKNAMFNYSITAEEAVDLLWEDDWDSRDKYISLLKQNECSDYRRKKV